MERHSSWFQLVAIVLVVVGLVGLATPAPAHAMDPQLILALASVAGAIALVTGYLIVANSRDKQRAASLEGVYACGEREGAGPMGCGGWSAPTSSVVAAASESPMAGDGRIDWSASPANACLGSQAAGPMGCDGSRRAESASSGPAPASPAATLQGQ
jgi:drug/metabolite transporter (DMT)-like permease